MSNTASIVASAVGGSISANLCGNILQNDDRYYKSIPQTCHIKHFPTRLLYDLCKLDNHTKFCVGEYSHGYYGKRLALYMYIREPNFFQLFRKYNKHWHIEREIEPYEIDEYPKFIIEENKRLEQQEKELEEYEKNRSRMFYATY